jgi:hypothetical protein
MPLAQATLAAELLAIAQSHPADEASAIQAFADAFHNYMVQSTVLGVPMVASLGLAAKALMIPAMVGLNTASATALQAGVLAYWGGLNVPGVWVATVPPTTPPPGAAGLAAALTPVFAANTAGQLDETASTNALAAAWHPLMLGGFAGIPPGPVPTPIL